MNSQRSTRKYIRQGFHNLAIKYIFGYLYISDFCYFKRMKKLNCGFCDDIFGDLTSLGSHQENKIFDKFKN